MRRTVALLSLVLGFGALLFGAAQLVLLSAGDTVEGTLTRVDYDDPETEIQHRRRSASKATGYFHIEIGVDYRFDVQPTAVEALQRVSTDPLHTAVRGSDTLLWRSRDPEAHPLKEGDSVRVLFLRAHPRWNRLHQPGSLRGEAITWGGAGLVLVVFGLLVRPRAGARPPPRKR